MYSASGSYGGTSLLRALAAFPRAQWLPGNGEWLVQPVAVEDLAKIVVKAVLNKTQGYHEVGGPTPMTLKDYQQTWRTWFRVKGQGTICVPKWLVSIQVWLSEYTGNGPIGNTMWKMLKRGNITTPDANKRLTQDFGIETRRLADVLAQHPSQVQDRWMAQLYFLAPALKIAVIALWLISSLAGFLTPAKDILAMVDGSLLQHTSPVGLARIGGALDMMLGVWLASGWRPRWAIGAMMLSVFAYTMIFGFSHPKYWLDPLGGLAKNLVLIPTLAILWVLSERR